MLKPIAPLSISIMYFPLQSWPLQYNHRILLYQLTLTITTRIPIKGYNAKTTYTVIIWVNNIDRCYDYFILSLLKLSNSTDDISLTKFINKNMISNALICFPNFPTLVLHSSYFVLATNYTNLVSFCYPLEV